MLDNSHLVCKTLRSAFSVVRKQGAEEAQGRAWENLIPNSEFRILLTHHSPLNYQLPITHSKL
ncbi:hypothetical protein [Chroococcidiopsis sp. CCALA 051]|uniref:hypothetical protein n=1 Tax=Chroococcidiopsis sp. CCALA 051 TaxID=869949 RepID=UPI0011B22770|nr:hypothetical protein [Chroococcidiopsis sp. CCALA 051]